MHVQILFTAWWKLAKVKWNKISKNRRVQRMFFFFSHFLTCLYSKWQCQPDESVNGIYVDLKCSENVTCTRFHDGYMLWVQTERCVCMDKIIWEQRQAHWTGSPRCVLHRRVDIKWFIWDSECHIWDICLVSSVCQVYCVFQLRSPVFYNCPVFFQLGRSQLTGS